MSKLSVKNEQLFKEVFKNQFGYYPKSKKKLLKDSDVNDENLSKLQLMGYIPYVVEVLEKFKKPCWRDVVRYRGKVAPTSSHTIGTMYRKMGFTKYDGRTMVKGDNFDKFLTTKWDWFDFKGSMVLVKGEEYSVRTFQSWDWCNRWERNYESIIPTKIKKKLHTLCWDWNNTKSEKKRDVIDEKWNEVLESKLIYQ